jgi:hypothetical protein
MILHDPGTNITTSMTQKWRSLILASAVRSCSSTFIPPSQRKNRPMGSTYIICMAASLKIGSPNKSLGLSLIITFIRFLYKTQVVGYSQFLSIFGHGSVFWNHHFDCPSLPHHGWEPMRQSRLLGRGGSDIMAFWNWKLCDSFISRRSRRPLKDVVVQIKGNIFAQASWLC